MKFPSNYILCAYFLSSSAYCANPQNIQFELSILVNLKLHLLCLPVIGVTLSPVTDGLIDLISCY